MALSGCSPQSLAAWLVPTRIVPPTPLLMVTAPAQTPTAAPTSTFTPTDTPTLTLPPTETSSPTPFPTWTPAPTETPTPTPTLEAADETGTGHLCFVLWDHQLAMYHYKPRNPKKPLPETCPLKSGAKNRITPAWQEYWMGILYLLNPEMSEKQFMKSWKGLTAPARAFTNKADPGSGGFALWSLTCGGATHEMVTGKPEKKYMRIYTLNINDPPPTIPSRPQDIDMTRHFFATTGSTKRLSNGSYAVYGFPQFENCIVPLVSPEDTDLIEVSRIKIVSSIQRPYNT